MHIVVCVNRIPDPEAPWYDVRLNDAGTAPLVDHMDLVMGPFDENALEVALQVRDAAAARVTALTAGPASQQEALRRALALRVEDAVHVLEERTLLMDSAGVASLLAAAVRRLGTVDLVLCGRQVGDWDSGQVGQILAEELGFSCVTLVREIQDRGNRMRVTREIPGGTCVADVRLPAVATITNSAANKLRVPKVKDAMAARRAPIPTWTASDLGIGVDDLLAEGRLVSVRRMYFPETHVSTRMIDPRNIEEAVEQLAQYIAALKIASVPEERAGREQ